jgi:ABC-type branched-subunit amino acid transport system ATPase component
VYVLKHGRVEMQGTAQAMSTHPELTKAYLGE